MDIITLKPADEVYISQDQVHLSIDHKKVMFFIDDIDKISIFTTGQGPFVDDIFLIIGLISSVFIIPSEHPQYESFLFDHLGKKIKIDYDKIIESSMSTDNAEFVLYTKTEHKTE